MIPVSIRTWWYNPDTLPVTQPPGTRLGPYAVSSPVGAVMGEVTNRDSSRRTVPIMIFRQFADDPQFRERFERGGGATPIALLVWPWLFCRCVRSPDPESLLTRSCVTNRPLTPAYRPRVEAPEWPLSQCGRALYPTTLCEPLDPRFMKNQLLRVSVCRCACWCPAASAALSGHPGWNRTPQSASPVSGANGNGLAGGARMYARVPYDPRRAECHRSSFRPYAFDSQVTGRRRAMPPSPQPRTTLSSRHRSLQNRPVSLAGIAGV